MPGQGRVGTIVVLLLVLAAAGLAHESRAREWRAWRADRPTYFAGDWPLVTSVEAGRYLAAARRLGGDRAPDSRLDTPLLAHWIRARAQSPDPGRLLWAANELLPISAALTAVAIALCFAALGYASQGAFAGLATSVAPVYLARSSIGRVDGDQLDLAFLFAILAAVALAWRSRARGWVLAASALAGALNLLFFWWDRHAGFTLPLALLLAAGVLVAQRRATTAALALAVFLLFSGGTQLLEVGPSLRHFAVRHAIPIAETLADAPASAPSTGTPSGDCSTSPPQSAPAGPLVAPSLLEGSGAGVVVVLGVLGLLLFAAVRPGRCAVLLPAMALGALGLASGHRFGAYSLPLLYFGLAFLISSLWAVGLRRLPWPLPSPLLPVAQGLAMAALMALAWGTSPVRCRPEPADRCLPHFLPRPVVTPQLTRGLRHLRELQPQGPATVVTWWSEGYWAGFVTDMDVVHDPATRSSATTRLLAQVLVGSDPDAAARVIRYLATSREAFNPYARGLERIRSAAEAAAAPPSAAPIYLVLTDGMLAQWPAIARAGRRPEAPDAPPASVAGSVFGQLYSGASPPEPFRLIDDGHPYYRSYELRPERPPSRPGRSASASVRPAAPSASPRPAVRAGGS